MCNPTAHVDELKTAAYQKQTKSRFASVLSSDEAPMLLSVVFLFCPAGLLLHLAYLNNCTNAKRGRGRIEREKGHELGLMGLAAHCATLPNI